VWGVVCNNMTPAGIVRWEEDRHRRADRMHLTSLHLQRGHAVWSKERTLPAPAALGGATGGRCEDPGRGCDAVARRPR